MKTASTLHCHGFNEHDRNVIKSLLRTFGELPNSIWSYADSETADLVLVDCDNLLAVRDAERGYLHGKLLVACSARGSSCNGAQRLLDKPLRPRHVIDLLKSLDSVTATMGANAANDAHAVNAEAEAEPLMMFPIMI
jgi:hypothetical protein